MSLRCGNCHSLKMARDHWASALRAFIDAAPTRARSPQREQQEILQWHARGVPGQHQCSCPPLRLVRQQLTPTTFSTGEGDEQALSSPQRARRRRWWSRRWWRRLLQEEEDDDDEEEWVSACRRDHRTTQPTPSERTWAARRVCTLTPECFREELGHATQPAQINEQHGTLPNDQIVVFLHANQFERAQALWGHTDDAVSASLGTCRRRGRRHSRRVRRCRRARSSQPQGTQQAINA